MIHEAKTSIIQQQVAERATTRSDVATMRRSISDLKSQVNRLQNNLETTIAQSENMEYTTFQSAWEQRKELNQLNKTISEIKDRLKQHTPLPSNARLTEQERNEIRGLHSSGLYTQQQLADQYGVTQPTISDLLRK